jgi:type IV secretory pathway VirB6-like protein
MRKLILVLGFLTAAAFAADAQNLANPNVRKHTKLQNSLSFDAVMDRNTGFTVESAKTALASEKEKAKAQKKTERENKKRDAIYARIEELKNN